MKLLTGLFLSTLVVLGLVGGFLIGSTACTPAAVSAVEGGAATAVQVTKDACTLLDPDGGLNPVVDVVCKTLDGRTVRVQMRREDYAALRASGTVRDGGGF